MLCPAASLRRAVLALCALGWSLAAAGAELENQLAAHPSPYLAMHGTDPVQWQVWDAATVARARRENKLLFVSSGYFSCHWCHVMQRESFRDPAVAALLNRHFIPVKVDRELDPALDERLIDFVDRTQGYAGWPLNVFVTPGGYPLVGMVYLPRDNLLQVLETVRERWARERDELAGVARQAAAELSAVTEGPAPMLDAALGRSYGQGLLSQAFELADEMQGGFGEENKFPSVPQLAALLDQQRRVPQPRLGDFLRLTLDAMATQGLRDQLGGGFFRYTVDPAWQVPHFEKMLYDNALLALLYFDAAQVFDAPWYAEVAHDTLDFMLRELWVEGGGFAASLSALDDNNVEGGYYLWDTQQVRALLDAEEYRLAVRAWQLEGPPDLEHGHHLVQGEAPAALARSLGISLATLEARLASARRKLLAARAARVLPRDDKRLASWNALALSALVRGAHGEDGRRYRAAARQVRDYLATVLWDGEQLHRALESAPVGQATLEDYANTAAALRDWAALSNSASDRRLAQRLIAEGWQRFHGPQGWQLAEDMLLRYGAGRPALPDGPLPAPSALLAELSLQAEPALAERAAAALVRGHDTVQAQPFWHATRIRVIQGYLESAGQGKR